MQKTTNYNLNQWEDGDRVTRADFNADNAAIDAALKGLATTVSGKLHLESYSYTGTGTYGAENPTTLTFTGTPQLIFIVTENSVTFCNSRRIFTFLSGEDHSTSSFRFNPHFSGNRFWFYSSTTAANQANAEGLSYVAFALCL